MLVSRVATTSERVIPSGVVAISRIPYREVGSRSSPSRIGLPKPFQLGAGPAATHALIAPRTVTLFVSMNADSADRVASASRLPNSARPRSVMLPRLDSSLL